MAAPQGSSASGGASGTTTVPVAAPAAAAPEATTAPAPLPTGLARAAPLAPGALAAADPRLRAPNPRADRGGGGDRAPSASAPAAAAITATQSRPTAAAADAAASTAPTKAAPAVSGGLKPELGILATLYSVQCRAEFEALAHCRRCEAGIRAALARYSQIKFADADLPFELLEDAVPSVPPGAAATRYGTQDLCPAASPPHMRRSGATSYRYAAFGPICFWGLCLSTPLYVNGRWYGRGQFSATCWYYHVHPTVVTCPPQGEKHL